MNGKIIKLEEILSPASKCEILSTAKVLLNYGREPENQKWRESWRCGLEIKDALASSTPICVVVEGNKYVIACRTIWPEKWNENGLYAPSWGVKYGGDVFHMKGWSLRYVEFMFVPTRPQINSIRTIDLTHLLTCSWSVPFEVTGCAGRMFVKDLTREGLRNNIHTEGMFTGML
jgi:hypothetical protein